MGHRQRTLEFISKLNAIVWICGIAFSNIVGAEEDGRSQKHPLIGYWESMPIGSECVETYWFREDGTAAFTSGNEQSEARYDVDSQPNEHGFFKLTHLVTASNKAQDCTHQVSEINKTRVNYLLFQPDGRAFISCDSDEASLSTCFGPITLKNNATKSLP